MKRLLSLILAMLLCVLVSAGCAPKEKPLVVGMELAYPPFETKDDSGNPTGISVDFATDLAAYLGRKVEIQNIAWDGLIPALTTGQVDVVISSMTITETRKEQINFSDPYAKSLLALLTNVNSNIATIEDLNQPGKKIAVKIGSTGHIYAEKHLTQAEIISLSDESACVMEVVQGKADGFIYDQLTIYRNQQKNPNETSAIFLPFQEPEFWGVGVKKGNEELLGKVNEFIAKYYAEGGFDKLTEKYLAQEKATFDELGFQWFFSGVTQ